MNENLELDWLKRWARYAPKSIALCDGHSNENITYESFYKQACAFASVLKNKYKVGPGDRVALLAQNELSSIVLFFALQRLGAILVPVNFRLTARELDYIFSDSKPKLLVHSEEFLPLTQQLNDENLKIPTSYLSNLKNLSLALESKQVATDFVGQFEDPVLILYTSGTTGFPKGALLNHRGIFWNSISTSLRLNVQQTDSAVIFLPLFHTGGWNVLTTPFLHRGAKVILLKKFDADLILKLSSSEKCTLLFGVPTTMDMMARSPEFAKADLSSLRYAIVGGEPMPVELIQTWHKKHVTIRQGYGLTEFGPNVFSLNEEDSIRKIGSIGFANFYIDTKVVDENGQACAANQVGELCLRGPAMMMGYWNKPEATNETIRDGWLHTGDLVRIDDEGYCYVVGRKKEMYISGAENVYPAEIEQVLYHFEGIQEAAVIGVPDPQWGEVGKAFVAVNKSALKMQSTEGFLASLKDYCLQNLAKYKVPKYFEIIDELPKSGSGKILKRALK